MDQKPSCSIPVLYNIQYSLITFLGLVTPTTVYGWAGGRRHFFLQWTMCVFQGKFWSTQAMFTGEQVAAGVSLLKSDMPVSKMRFLLIFVNMWSIFYKIWLILIGICQFAVLRTYLPTIRWCCCARCLVASTWYHELGTQYLVPRTWYKVFGTKYLVTSLWFQVLAASTWQQVLCTFGAKCLVPITRCRSLGTM